MQPALRSARPSLLFSLLALALLFASSRAARAQDWTDDFNHQPVAARPVIDIRYTSGQRTAFEILADTYHLTGRLTKPLQLMDASTSANWLTLELVDGAGTVYSGLNPSPAARINIYRHGAYFYEAHWLDYQFATAQGALAPIKADVGLYCYPEKILVKVQLIASAAFDARTLRATGINPADFSLSAFATDQRQFVSFPLFGEDAPLPAGNLTTLSGLTPLAYNAERGCYTISSANLPGDIFYETPNGYESVAFRIQNNATRRKIYICHKNGQGLGNFNGAVIRDAEGHPLPILLQMSKNFSGEIEEPLYVPGDDPYCELYYPLYLEPNESVTLTSQHLRQHWGRFMTKHWSSLGAWMGYFQSSTGITETTCYVPFKYLGTPGIQIADFRAMSHAGYWTSQPQHDNVAGHSFMSYYLGLLQWAHTEYRGAVPYSTGMHQFDVGLNYLTTDNKMSVSVRTFEYPQPGELRTFVHMEAEALAPITVSNPERNFRLIEIAGRIQSLNYTQLHASGAASQAIPYNQGNFPLSPVALAPENSWFDVTGVAKGSNAVFIRQFSSTKPMNLCANIQIGRYNNRLSNDRAQDMRAFIGVQGSQLQLAQGDRFALDGYFCPNGHLADAAFAPGESLAWGANGPRVTNVATGSPLSDFPLRVQSDGSRAVFTIEGGRDLLTVAVHGFTSFKNPRLYRKGYTGTWIPLALNRVDAFDGASVFAEGNGLFGATFPVNVDGHRLTLMATVDEPAAAPARLVLTALSPGPGNRVQVTLPGTTQKVELRIENALTLDGAPLADPHTPAGWSSGVAGSFYSKTQTAQQLYGSYVIPDEGALSVQTWWQPLQNPATLNCATTLTLTMQNSSLLDQPGTRLLGYRSGNWVDLDGSGPQRFAVGGPPPAPDFGALAIVSPAYPSSILAMAWPGAAAIKIDRAQKLVAIGLAPCGGASLRYVQRGKLHLFAGSLEDLARAISLDNNSAPYTEPQSAADSAWMKPAL